MTCENDLIGSKKSVSHNMGWGQDNVKIIRLSNKGGTGEDKRQSQPSRKVGGRQ